MMTEQRGERAISLRAVLLGIAAEFLLFVWVAASEISGDVYLICYSLLYPAVALLVFVAVGNWLLGRIFPRAALSEREILTVYIMVTCALPLAGFGMTRFLIPSLVLPAYSAALMPAGSQQVSATNWAAYRDAIHPWLVPHGTQAAVDFFLGGVPVPWGAWVMPLLWWGSFFAALAILQLAAAVLFERQWVRSERLTFPIVYLPLEMTREGPSFLRNPVMLAGFLIPFTLQSLLAINHLFPAIPARQLKAWSYQPFSSLPWSAFGGIAVGWYPVATGLAYFIPTDISFSCWFFLIFMHLMKVVVAAFGVEVREPAFGESRFPFIDEQGTGGWIAIAALSIFAARHHLRTVALRARQGDVLYRRAFAALLVSAAFLIAFSRLLRVPAALLAAILAVYLLYVLVAARVRAEVGTQWTFSPHITNANYVFISTAGSGAFSQRTLVNLAVLEGVTVDVRGQPLAPHMESMKMAETTAIPIGRLSAVILLATIAGLAFAFWTSMNNWYATGADTAKANLYQIYKGRLNFQRLQPLLESPSKPNITGFAAMLLAGMFTLGLAVMRVRFQNWPFHPIGYALANTITIRAFWMSYLFATIAKWVVLRYGGAGLYRKSIPFFVGIIMGDALAQALWSLAGQLLHFPVYQFLT
jgi:hypothetical protein